MRAHYLQHVPFEGLGSIAPWLESAGYEITRTQFFAPAALPDIRAIDLLVVMGGPMSVNDEAEFPWLVAEKKFIKEAIDAGKPVLGVCLGAQLIASALGARVYRNAQKEIGWYPILGIAQGGDSCFRFPPSVQVFHWHGETFDLPAGAIHLARSQGCEYQAFQVARSVLGLQFHLEVTPDSVEGMIGNCGDELVPAKYVQSAEEIRAARPEDYRQINRLMGEILAFLVRNAG